MPAKSKAQQRLMALAMHSPGKVRAENRSVLTMSKSEMNKFASTSTKDLPKYKNAFRSIADGDSKVVKQIMKSKKRRK